MKILYWDCTMGAAGDMLAASLLELCPDRDVALAGLNGLGIPGVVYRAEPCVRGGIAGTRLRVLVNGQEEQPDGAAPAPHTHSHTDPDAPAQEAMPAAHVHSHGAEPAFPHDHTHGEPADAPAAHSHEPDHTHSHDEADAHGHDHLHDHDHDHSHPGHAHHSLADVTRLIRQSAAPAAVQDQAVGVYQAIAAAEGQVHGHPVDQVHFHEVGALDAVADILAVCWLVHHLAPARICASPVEVGGGTVRCAHGILPVPAPATALLLRDMPITAGACQTELCTPTGAALLKCLVSDYGPMPAMRLLATGHGCGGKDLPGRANCVTACWGEADTPAAGTPDGPMDTVCQLQCNLDDMTGEAIGYALARLREAGALDAFTTAIGMKKDRPAVMLTCLCRPDQEREMAALMLRHTTTLGVRVQTCRRYTLARAEHTLDTPFGPVRVKTASGWGVTRAKPEWEDLARIAARQDLPLDTVRRQVEALL